MKQFYMDVHDNIFNNYESFLKNIPVQKIVTAILLFLGVAFICSGVWRGHKNKINPGWSVINGVVVNSIMESCTIPSKDGENLKNTYYNSKITYEYDVNGHTITRDTNIGGVSRNDPAIAEKAVKSFSEGKLVKIFYNPENPEESLINTFTALEKWFPIICGTLFVFFGLLNVFYVKADDHVIVNHSVRSSKSVQQSKEKSVKKEILQEETPENYVYEINGNWKLNYQIPSMVEMISLSNKPSGGAKISNALNSADSKGAAMLTINDGKMIFNFNTEDVNADFNILSMFCLNGNRLMLEHQNIDLPLKDIEGFPPEYYTYSYTGSTLVLTTNKIKGLGDRQLTYHFSKSDQLI